MTIKQEIALQDFEFWGNAARFTDNLTWRELGVIEEYLEGMYNEINATELNDMFAFDDDFLDFVARELLHTTVEEIYNRHAE